jgi:hypothetical protein
MIFSDEESIWMAYSLIGTDRIGLLVGGEALLSNVLFD